MLQEILKFYRQKAYDSRHKMESKYGIYGKEAVRRRKYFISRYDEGAISWYILK